MSDDQKIKEELLARGVPESAFEEPKAAAEVEVDAPEEVSAEPAPEKPKELSEIEKRAMKTGWKPDGKKSAEEWINAEPLHNELKHRGKEIHELKKTIDEMKEFMMKQREAGYKQAMAELKARKDEAIYAGDLDTVQKIEQQMMEQYEDHKGPAPAAPTNPNLEAVEQFKERNQAWLDARNADTLEMRNYAYQRDNDLIRLNLDPEEHMRILEEDVRRKFSDYFGESEKPLSAPPVETDTNFTGKVRKKFGLRDLDDVQRATAKHFQDHGVMTAEEYIKQLVELGELK